MLKNLLSAFLVFLSAASIAQGPFPPAAGVPGTTAISKDSAIIQSWASGIELVRGYIQINDTTVYNAGSNKATFGHPVNALGLAEGSSTGVVSLGDGGMTTLTFDRYIVNGPGADFAVFENSFGDTFLELAFVEVSSDGVHFVRFPSVSLTPTAVQTGAWEETDPTLIHNLAGKYRQGFGTPFDLDDVADQPLLDVNAIRFVRVIDVVGCIQPAYASLDAQGNIVNDPWPTPFNSGGFDLDGVAVINGGTPNYLAGLTDLQLAPDSYFLPAENGTFNSGICSFPYEAGTGYWSGFSYSSRVTLNGDYTNDQFVAVTNGGMDGDSTTFAIAYVASDWMGGTYDPIPSVVNLADGQMATFSGCYVSNNAMAYITMRDGTLYNKKFGGDSGNDPDWFRIKVRGVRADNSLTEPLMFYLADFRFTDNSLDYIVQDWRWFDLSALGEVKSLSFVLESSDSGDFGVNTPAYFCMDNLTVLAAQAPFISQPVADISVPVNAAPLTIDLLSHFSASGAPITFEISYNSNPAVVFASVSDHQLGLEFVPDVTGLSEISIAASANGITVTDTFTVEVYSSVGINEVCPVMANAYPNPCAEQLNLSGVANTGLRLFDSRGCLVFDTFCETDYLNIPVSHLQPGVYVLRLSKNEKVQSIRVIKL